MASGTTCQTWTCVASYDDASPAASLALLPALGLLGISGTYLPDEVLEDVVDVPITLRTCLIERQPPSVAQCLDM